MKQCTYCGKEYPDEATVCSLDQQPLEFVSSASATPTSPDSPSSKGWLRYVLVPAAVWLLVNLLLMVLFTFGATFVFGLLTAVWAAVDCSKMQLRGSRVLGIVFKPVVVFATVAFLLCGVGFIWYLVMRHRVRTAPGPLETASEKVAA